MYSTGIAYLLWALSFFGAAGFHRFYLGKIPTGILWLCTGGLAGIGSIYDLITLPGQVREANFRKALFDQGGQAYANININTGNGGGFRPAGQPDNWRYANDAQYRVVRKDGGKKENLEHTILKLAKENKGVLTVSEVALEAQITVDEAKKHLEMLVSRGFAELRVRKSGSLVYVIPDMMDKDVPLEDF